MTTIERMELTSVEATDKDLESIVEQEIIDEDLSLDEVVKSFRKSNINIYH